MDTTNAKLGSADLIHPSTFHNSKSVARHRELWLTGKYSDVTVRCGPNVYHLHRAFICSTSKFFAAACDGDFREAHEAQIVLADDDPSTVARMLEYIYVLNYSDDSSVMPGGSEPNPFVAPGKLQKRILNNVLVYAMADKYDIEPLKEVAKEKFGKLMSAKWPHHDLVSILTSVYETTPASDKGLQSILNNVCKKHVKEILEDPNMQLFMEENGDFTLDMLKDVSNKWGTSMKNLDAQIVSNQVAEATEVSLKASASSMMAQWRKACEQGRKAADALLKQQEDFEKQIENAQSMTECKRCGVGFPSFPVLERTPGVKRVATRLLCKCGGRNDL